MDYQSLHNKTVVELRKLAKEMKVKLPAKTSKAMIVELLLEAEKTAAAAESAAREALPAPNTEAGLPQAESSRSKETEANGEKSETSPAVKRRIAPSEAPKMIAAEKETPKTEVARGKKIAKEKQGISAPRSAQTPAAEKREPTGRTAVRKARAGQAEGSRPETSESKMITPQKTEPIPARPAPTKEKAHVGQAEVSRLETAGPQNINLQKTEPVPVQSAPSKEPEKPAGQPVLRGQDGRDREPLPNPAAIAEHAPAANRTQPVRYAKKDDVQAPEGGNPQRFPARMQMRGQNGYQPVNRPQRAAAQRVPVVRSPEGMPKAGGETSFVRRLQENSPHSIPADPIRRGYDENRRVAEEAPRRSGDDFRPQYDEPVRRSAEEQGGEAVRRRDAYEIGADGAPIGDFTDGAGLLEIQPEGHGFLRAENCLPSERDVYISIAQIRRFCLRNGDYVEGKTRPQREGDRYGAMVYINRINGEPPEKALSRKPFESLIPLYPNERLRLESPANHDLSLRLIDIFAPIGKGQRGMIVSQPKAGKTTILKKVANAISDNNPEVKLIVLLIDERPEEVTDMKRSIRGDVIYSTFDEAPENHARVSEMVLDHARRMVEMGKDVVILLDSITRLARAYNLVIPPTGRSLSGGLDPGALYKPKKFFGAARNIENGGSLTIIATALVDTGSRMDDIIFEEFKGTGNMELHLDRKLSDKRIFPAIDLVRSGTRREELLLSPRELEGEYSARRMLANGNAQQNAELLISLIEKTSDNEDFLNRVKGWVGVYEKDGFTMGR